MAFGKDTPLVSATKFHVPYSALDDGSAAYGTVVNAGSGNWIIGSALKGRRIKVVVFNGTLTGAPTGLKVGLYVGDDANGTNGAVVSGTTTEWATPAASTYRQATDIDLTAAAIDPAKYYSLGLSLNGAGTTALSAAALGEFLDPAQKS